MGNPESSTKGQVRAAPATSRTARVKSEAATGPRRREPCRPRPARQRPRPRRPPRHHALLDSAARARSGAACDPCDPTDPTDSDRNAARTRARWSIITDRATPSSTAQAAPHPRAPHPVHLARATAPRAAACTPSTASGDPGRARPGHRRPDRGAGETVIRRARRTEASPAPAAVDGPVCRGETRRGRLDTQRVETHGESPAEDDGDAQALVVQAERSATPADLASDEFRNRGQLLAPGRRLEDDEEPLEERAVQRCGQRGRRGTPADPGRGGNCRSVRPRWAGRSARPQTPSACAHRARPSRPPCPAATMDAYAGESRRPSAPQQASRTSPASATATAVSPTGVEARPSHATANSRSSRAY